MVHFFTGTPGSGKSLHMAMVIDKQLKKGKNVIANFEINESIYKRWDEKHPGKRGMFIYAPNTDLLNSAYRPYKDDKGRMHAPPDDKFSYIEGLYGFAANYHKVNSKGQITEGQTLLVLDECQELFNPRSWNRKDRLKWCSFFREHRKYGYEVYLISQDDTVIDKQIRHILQFEYEHRCVNNYKLLGRVLGVLSGGKLFIYIQRIYGLKKKDAKVKVKYFQGERKYYEFYDSYKTFGQQGTAENTSQAVN